MNARIIKEQLQIKPFPGMRLHVSDGAAYDILDPDNVFILTGRVMLGLEPDADGIPTTSISIDPMHITRITPINGA